MGYLKQGWFWFGNQGLSYIQLGRFWQLGFFAGLLIRSALVFRALWSTSAMLRQATRQFWSGRIRLENLIWAATLNIAVLYVFGMIPLVEIEKSFTITDFWRWWVVHLWVEQSFEFFAASMSAYLLMAVGLVSRGLAERVVYFALILIFLGAVLGTGHHLYWTGGPSMWVPLGSMFSFIEELPLVLLIIEAIGQYRLIRAQQVFHYRLAYSYIIGAVVWNFVGAGVFGGGTLNAPLINYYVHGTFLTLNHAIPRCSARLGCSRSASSISACATSPATARRLANGSAFSETIYHLSWRGALIFKPLPNGSIYFDAGTSFDPSAEALSLSAANAALPPVENKSYEFGGKWEFFESRMAIDGALFRTNQINVSEPDPNNPNFNILAGDALAEGFELDAAGHITERWQVIAGYAYTYSVIDKSPRVGPTSELGHRLANVPAHTANLWTTYNLPWWGIQVGGGLNVVSSRFAATTPTTAGGVNFFKEAPGYYTLNAMAKYPINEKVSLQCNIYNITDNKYYDQLHPSHVVPGAGTTALFTLNFKI